MSGSKKKLKKVNIRKIEKPLISVVMPSYNQGDFIGAAIDSFFKQEYDNKELIIVDNISTDSTNSILKKNARKTRIIREKDNGQTDAINKGLKASKGDILAYLNSDDVYERGAFKHVSDFFLKNPDKKIVYGIGKFIDHKGRMTGYYNTKSPTLDNLLKECVISQPTVFMKREVYEKLGGFDESMHYAMDYDYWVRAVKHFKFGFIKKPLASTRIHSRTKTATQQEKVFNEVLQSQKKNIGNVSDEGIFNYAYAAATTPWSRLSLAARLIFSAKTIFKATSKYIKYGKIPGTKGLRHYVYLLKSTFLNYEK